MYSHAPPGYDCPFCRNVSRSESDLPLQIVHHYDNVFVKMNPESPENNPGSALVIPVEHYENLYELPAALGEPLQRAVQDTALAMKAAFGCKGISTRQHNEPAGNQDVWHYHVHVIPRYEADDLYGHRCLLSDADELRRLASLLRGAWPCST